MLTPEQVEVIKQRLIQQIEATFPEDRKQFAKEQVDLMDAEQLEQFLIKNNLLRTEAGSEGGESKDNCIFCSIVAGKVKSYKIAENSDALAVLEINPLSRGHAIIIPKNHVASSEEMPTEAKNLAKKVSSLIKSRLKPKTIKTESSNLMGHEIINIIPVYEKENAEKRPASPEELSALQELLTKQTKRQPKETSNSKPKIKKIKKVISTFEDKLWLPKRIP